MSLAPLPCRLLWRWWAPLRMQVLSSSSFENADLTDVDFTDAYIGQFDQRRMCKNPTLQGENPVTGAPTRASLGCSQ